MSRNSAPVVRPWLTIWITPPGSRVLLPHEDVQAAALHDAVGIPRVRETCSLGRPGGPERRSADMASFMKPYTSQTYAALRIMAGLMFAFHGAQKLFGFPTPAPDPAATFIFRPASETLHNLRNRLEAHQHPLSDASPTSPARLSIVAEAPQTTIGVFATRRCHCFYPASGSRHDGDGG